MQNRRMPSDVSVRPTTGDDQAHVLRTVREAFSGGVGDGREEVEIVEAVWSLGHVLASPGRLDGSTVPGIAPLAVRPDRQGEGIGTALMTDLLRRLDRQGCPLVVVLGDPRYHGRFGFQPSGPLGIHYPPIGADSPQFQVLQLGDHRETSTGNYVFSWEAPVK